MADDVLPKTSRQLLEAFVDDNSSELESLADWISITDVDGTVVYASDAYLKALRLPKNKVVGYRNIDFFSPEFQQQKVPEIAKMIFCGNSWQGEVPVPLPDGKELHGWVHVSPLYSEEKEIIGTLSIAFDLMERKSLLPPPETPSQLWDKMLEGLATNVNGEITFVGEKTALLGRWTKEEMLSESVFRYVAPEARAQAQQIFSSIIEKRSYKGKLLVLDKEGNVRPAWISVKPIIDESGRVIGTIQEQGIRCLTAEEVEAFQKRWPNNHQTGTGSELKAGRMDTLMLQIMQSKERALKSKEDALHTLAEKEAPAGVVRRQASQALKVSKNTLRVQCLGELKVSSDSGEVKHWQSKPAKLVFEYLIAKHGSPVTREALMEMLWPDQAPESSFNNLKAVIYRLRETLHPLFDSKELHTILFKEGRYTINPEIVVNVDFIEFEHHLKQGNMLEKEGKLAEAQTEYEEAEKLYLDDFLEEELYQEWTIPQRESLKDLYLLMLDKLAEWAIGSADYEKCIKCCHKILAKDAYREDTYRRLMLCCSRLGQSINALKWYDRCRRVMDIDMGIPLSPETVAMHDRVKNGYTL